VLTHNNMIAFIATALAHSGKLTLLCLGPLTNVAVALQKEACLAPSLHRIILMGEAVAFL
jgi:purine nucleosidase